MVSFHNTNGLQRPVGILVRSGFTCARIILIDDTDGASSAEIKSLTLSQNNPILPVISSIGQNGTPNIEILTTDYPGEIVGAWAGNTDATLTYTPGSPVEVYQEGYPMSLIYLGVGDKGTKYKVLYHGLDRQLYEMDYDGTRWVELEFRVKF
jgi:hypothetical protein